MNKYKILCIDDDEEVLSIYSMMLNKLGHEIVKFNNFTDAITFVKDHGNEIIYIFSDFNISEMNGLEFRRRINETGFDIPFALITGYYNKEMSKIGMDIGVSAFVEKPFDEVKLTSLVAGLGEKRRLLLEEDREMIISFIEESYPMLLEIENLIMSLESEPENTIYLNTYFRLLHTIKGTASCVGLRCLPKFTHKYEDLVVRLQGKTIDLSPVVADVLLKGLDYLKFMYGEIQKGCFEFDIQDGLLMFDFENEKNYIAGPAITKESDNSAAKKNPDSGDHAEEKIGVPVSTLDDFMELNGQITVIRNTLLKSAVVLSQRYHGDAELEMLLDSLEEMQKVSSSFQVQIAEMRKISLEIVYKPLKRVVRDASKSLNKSIDFQVDGEDLRVDTLLGKALSNSLVHMIRNSIDHGIELPEKRAGVGKKEQGVISLKTFQEGENVIVELSDDGNGLSVERIKKKAVEKNIYTEEQLANMSDQKIFAIIFDSGFSTAQQVSDISGRGVGMDMVKNSIESIGGKIVINSKEGFGTKFTMTLPIPRSVLIIKSLMVKSNNATFSIPLDEVAEVVRLEDYNESKVFHRIEQSFLLSHHGELLPLVDLKAMLFNENNITPEQVLNIVIVNADGQRFGIIVDEIMDIEEIVVKKMSKTLEKANYFIGVTFLGHGALALILNIGKMVEKMQLKNSGGRDKSDEDHIVKNIVLQEFMQFNLLHSGNYSLPLDVVSRLEEIPTSSVEYSGAIPLIRYRGDVMPLIFVERQLGFCSADKVLAQVYPDILNVVVINLHNKKIGLVVDEILDIGLTTDVIETRNIDRSGVLGTVFIGDKTVTVLDVSFIVDNNIKFEKEHLKEDLENSSKTKAINITDYEAA